MPGRSRRTKAFNRWVWGAATDFGQPYGANVILPKLLLLEATQDIIKKRTAEGVASRDNVLRQLETILNEGYEGVGWTIFKAGRQLDKHVHDTLTHALTEYINGPESPTSGDELTFFMAREVMPEFSPRLMLVNFWDMDVAHWGSYSLYLQAITKTDRLTSMLWDEVQSNPHYKDKTTMLVLPEVGRDADINAANGFLNHRSGDASCRNVWMLALGAGVPRGETDRPMHHIDISATAASLLGVKTGEMSGQPMRGAAAVMPATPKLSPPVQELIDKGLFERLPVSFSAFCFDQMKDWDLLFPYERGYFERLFALLDRSGQPEVDRLFAPMREAEARMGVNEKTWPKRQFTLEQVDFLNRNPHYPEWRAAVSNVFASIDPLLDADVVRHGRSRLVIVVTPADLPTDPDRMWLRIAAHGKRIALAAPDKVEDFLPLLLTGKEAIAKAPPSRSYTLPLPKHPTNAGPSTPGPRLQQAKVWFTAVTANWKPTASA